MVGVCCGVGGRGVAQCKEDVRVVEQRRAAAGSWLCPHRSTQANQLAGPVSAVSALLAARRG